MVDATSIAIALQLLWEDIKNHDIAVEWMFFKHFF